MIFLLPPSLLVASDTYFEREIIVSKVIAYAKTYYKIEKFDSIISIGVWDLLTAQKIDLDFIGIGQKKQGALLELFAYLVFNDLIQLQQHLKL